MIIKQGAVFVVEFFMADSADHVTGKISLAPTVTLSKAGGAWGAAAGAVAEIGGAGNGVGQYKCSLTVDDTDTLGELWLQATAAGSDGAMRYIGTVQAKRVAELDDGAIVAATLAADAITAAKIANGAIGSTEAPLLANLDAAVTTRAVAGDEMALVNDAITAAKIAAGAIGATEAPNLDAAVSSRAVPAIEMRVDGYLIQMMTAFRPLLFTLKGLDGVTPLTGGAPTCLLWKYGGAFGAPAGAVSEIGRGLYQIAPNATDCNTNGPLVLDVTCAGALPQKFVYYVVAFDPYSIANMGMTNLDAAISTRSSHAAADIWAVGARTLTSYGTLVADVATAVWGAGARTLTSFGTLVADTATAVWAAGARTLTSFGTLPTDVWAVGARTLTSYGTLVADIATAVWGAGARTLTAFGTLVADTAAGVWGAGARTLTASGDPTAAQVADAVWDEAAADHVAAGSMGRALADILQIENGRWEIDKIANTLVLYADDDVTPLFSFSLLDNAAVSSRTPI